MKKIKPFEFRNDINSKEKDVIRYNGNTISIHKEEYPFSRCLSTFDVLSVDEKNFHIVPGVFTTKPIEHLYKLKQVLSYGGYTVTLGFVVLPLSEIIRSTATELDSFGDWALEVGPIGVTLYTHDKRTLSGERSVGHFYVQSHNGTELVLVPCSRQPGLKHSVFERVMSMGETLGYQITFNK